MLVPCCRKAFLIAVVGLAAVAAPGCDKGGGSAAPNASPVDGHYKNAGGETVVELKEGTAYITNLKAGNTTGYPFTVNGDKVTVNGGAQGTFALTIGQDGSLVGLPAPLTGTTQGVTLKKAQ